MKYFPRELNIVTINYLNDEKESLIFSENIRNR